MATGLATAMEQEFRTWREQSQALVELLRVEDGALVLTFSRPGDESPVATVSLTPVEGGGFFAEGLEDPPEWVEDWLTDANGRFSDQTSMSLGQALSGLSDSLPGPRDGNVPMGEDEDEDVVLEEDDDDLLQAVQGIEAAETRQEQRAADAEDRRWESMAAASAPQGSRQASQVLMREMRALMALQGEGETKALEIEMVQDSLYHWNVLMHAKGFPQGALREDLERFGGQHSSNIAAVVMEVKFPNDYPMTPPFIRVVRPRFQFHTGHITIGGSICMQLLTTAGWLPSVALENVFVSIRSEIAEGGGRVDFHNTNDYSVAEAREAFTRVAKRYGWA